MRMAHRHQQGLTLIEIQVAFMILTLSLTIIFRIFSGGLRNIALSEDYARSVLVAESQLSAIGISEPLESGVTSGKWDVRFRWVRVVENFLPWEENKELTAPLLAYRVTVNVDWEHAGHARQITLRSVRLKKVERKGGQGL